MERSHSLLSPSGASRWIACTPSARIEQGYPDKSNDAADEGTLAHELCQVLVGNHFKLMKSVLVKESLKKIRNHKLYSKEMEGHCDDYLQFVVERYQDMEKGKRTKPVILLEEELDLTQWIPDGKGHLDLGLIHDHTMEIIDFKYGKGVKVEAHENKQMMIYGAGAYLRHQLLYDIKMIRMTIHQPRLSNYSSFEMEVDPLMEFMNTVVLDAASKAIKGEGDLVPGDHCRFCKARVQCRALADQMLELARFEFEDVEKLSDHEISEILEKAPVFKTWIGGIEKYALAKAVHEDKKWPNFKLVSGRSNRVITDPEAVIAALKKAKISKDQFLTDPKLYPLGTLEKNLGKDEVQRIMGRWIQKPPGAPALVPSWDKRPEINSAEAAKSAFDEIELD